MIMFRLIKKKSDIEEVVILAKEIWFEHYTPIIGRAQVIYMTDLFQSFEAISRHINKEDYSYYFIINENNKIIGYFAVVQQENNLFLSKLYIKEVQRGKGVGKSVIDFISNIAINKNLNKITLTVNKYNKNSIKFYKRNGFITVSSIIFDLGNGYFMDDFQMEKRIF